MADEWQKVTVEDIAAPSRNALVGGPFGSNLVARDYVEQGVPVIRGQNMGGRWVSGEFAYVTEEKAQSLAANLARPGDILFTQRGTLGQVSLVPNGQFDQFVVSQSQMKLTVNRDVADPLFFYYFFASSAQQEYIRQHAIQTGVPHTNLGILRATPVPLPPLTQQRAIARILGTLDDKIELNRRISETLEATARALFKSWFVDFDPVRAKSQGRDSGLSREIVDLFPDRFIESELGEIPEGWNVVRIGDLAEIEKGLSYKGSGLTVDEGLPMINLGCFAGQGRFKDERIKRYAGEYRERHLVGPCDLLIANTDMTQNRIILGSPILIPASGSEPEYLFTHHTYAFRFFPGSEAWRRYVYLALLRPEFREIAEGFATGTTVIALPRDGILSYSLALPTEPLRAAFEKHIEVLLGRIDCACQQSKCLAALRDVLLPRLISGQLCVKTTKGRSLSEIQDAEAYAL